MLELQILVLLMLALLALSQLSTPMPKDIEDSLNQLKQLEDNISRRRLQTTSTCNLTRYKEWLNERYIGVLSADSEFWMYQTQPQIILNNFFALNLAVRGCQRKFESLYLYRAGRMGPVTVQDAYKIMCREYCLESDNIHELAMNITGCSCLELSTQSDEISYTMEGDWCRHNTARMLCDMIGYCGVWNCRIDDFMCPRYEWNKKVIPLKGPGTCIRGAGFRSFSTLSPGLTLLLALLVGLLGLLYG